MSFPGHTDGIFPWTRSGGDFVAFLDTKLSLEIFSGGFMYQKHTFLEREIRKLFSLDTYSQLRGHWPISMLKFVSGDTSGGLGRSRISGSHLLYAHAAAVQRKSKSAKIEFHWTGQDFIGKTVRSPKKLSISFLVWWSLTKNIFCFFGSTILSWRINSILTRGDFFDLNFIGQ